MSDENESVLTSDDVLSGGADEADMSGASPTTRALFRRGSQMSGVDFSEIENRRRQATEEKLAAIRRGHAALMQQRPDNTEALFALARGFLSPTRTGSFGESLGLAAGEAGPAMQRQRQLEEQRRQQAGQYEAQIAQVRAQGVDDEYRSLLDRAKRGETLMTRAAQLAAAEARAREQAEARRENMDLRRDIAQQGADARTSGQMATSTVNLDEATLARLAQSDPRVADMKPGAYVVQYSKTDPANSMRIVGRAEQKKQEDTKLPATLIKEQNSILENIGLSSSMRSDIDAFAKQINAGKLDFGAFSNWVNRGRNIVGPSSEESRNFADFEASLEKLRNDSLRLNSGVQTEGDAQRAWSELMRGMGDKKIVKQRLEAIAKINERGARLQELKLNQMRREHGLPPIDSSQFTSVESPYDRGSISKEAEEILKMYPGKR